MSDITENQMSVENRQQIENTEDVTVKAEANPEKVKETGKSDTILAFSLILLSSFIISLMISLGG